MTFGFTVVISLGWALRCSFNLFPNVLENSPICPSSHSNLSFESIYHSILFSDVIFVLVSHQEVLDGVSSSDKYLNPMFSTCILKALNQAFGVWYCYLCLIPVGGSCCVVLLISTTVVVVVVVVVVRNSSDTILYLILFKVHMGYLHLNNAF